jgi:hypothetical protein
MRSLALLPLFLTSLAFADTGQRVPIQAELVKTIEAGRVQVGDPVLAKVSQEWKSDDCHLRAGAILRGHVVAQTARAKGTKSELAILFDSGECAPRTMKRLPLIVAALLAPETYHGLRSLSENQETQPLNEAVGSSLNGGMRSVSAAASAVILEPPRSKPPQVVMPGQVIGLSDVQLKLGEGPQGSTIVYAEKHNMRLDSGSRLVLVENVKLAEVPEEKRPSDVTAISPAAPAGNAPTAPAAAENPEADLNDDTCAPPACSEALSVADTSENTPASATASASITIPLKKFGFLPPPDQEIYGLDHEVAVSYLGPEKVLVTFNPHVLVSRSNAESALPKLHMVRAVLVDLPKMRAVHTHDWRVPDAQQYLWPMGSDRVLVHVGGELRLYGPGLNQEHSLSLGGNLAFVQVSPMGNYFAAGIIRERHTEAIHRELADAENREPEEDVEVKVLDANFRTLATVMRSSRDVQPVLTEEGEVRIPTIGKNRWRIVEYTWTSQRRVLKQVESTCRPEASSLPPDLLFVTGCDRLADGRWYRIMRPDGKLVLKGWLSSKQKGQSANGSFGGDTFAVGVDDLTKAVDATGPFHSSDLKDQHVDVYSVENGKRLTGVLNVDLLPTWQTFALSPDGRQLALIEKNQLVIYPLPAATTRRVASAMLR